MCCIFIWRCCESLSSCFFSTFADVALYKGMPSHNSFFIYETFKWNGRRWSLIFLFLIYIIGRHSITSASQPNGAHCDAKEYTSTFSWPSPMILHQNFVNYIFTVLDFYRHVILLHNNSPLQRRRRRENLYLLLLLLLFLCCVMTGFSLHLLLHEYYYIRFAFFVCNMPHDR